MQRPVLLSDEQPLFATSSCTMVCVDFTAVSARPSSGIFRRGLSTSPCMTGSKPASANCHWASIRWSQSQNGSIRHRPPRVISRSYASIRGPFTFSRPWPPARPAPSVPIRSGSSKRASWCVLFIPGFTALPVSLRRPSLLDPRSTNNGIQTQSRDERRYRHTLDAALTIYRSEGIRAFYRGLLPSLLGIAHVAVQFPLYEQLKIMARKLRTFWLFPPIRELPCVR